MQCFILKQLETSPSPSLINIKLCHPPAGVLDSVEWIVLHTESTWEGVNGESGTVSPIWKNKDLK